MLRHAQISSSIILGSLGPKPIMITFLIVTSFSPELDHTLLEGKGLIIFCIILLYSL